METNIGSEIEIIDPTQEILDWAEKWLTLTNPEYTQLKLLGKDNLIKWRRVPEKLCLYAKRGNRLILPFGLLKAVWKFIYKNAFNATFNNAGEISIADCKPAFPLYDYQEIAVNAMLKAKGGVLVAPCGGGKGLPLDAKIYTPDGWKRNGDLVIGDKVIGSNGQEITVTGIFDKGKVPAYKLTFTDNTEIVCDKDHLWSVQDQTTRNNRGPFKTKDTESIYKYYLDAKLKNRRCYEYFIPIVEPVNFKPKEVPIDPWVLGFLIGDGCLLHNAISFSNTENDLIEKATKNINGVVKKRDKFRHDYSITHSDLASKIRNLGLADHRSYEKFIPDIYKYNDIKTRLGVLQGLFDTDGSVSFRTKGGMHYEYTTTSLQLAKDFVEIVESLGGTAKTKARITHYTYKGERKEGRVSYRIHFKLYKFLPCTSQKHLAKIKPRTKYVLAYRRIKTIEPCEPIISRCITVDAKDELYVTDHFIVTHNTMMGIEIIRRIGKKALWLCSTGDLLRQAKADMEELYPSIKIGLTTEGKLEIGEDVTISTVQTLSKIDPSYYKNEFDVIICDECAHVFSVPSKLQMFGKVLTSIPARFKFGLTATPTRSGGADLIRAMYAYLGCDNNGEFAPAYKVPKEEVKTITAIQEKIELYNGYDEVSQMMQIYDTSGMIVYNDLINALSEDNGRTDKIIENIIKCDAEGRKQVVLTLRVEHCKIIAEKLLERGINAVVCTGAVTAKKRKEILTCKTDWKVLVATYSLLKEGVSIKALDTLHLATPIKEKAMIVQSVGRIERYMDNKKQPIVYDYVDIDIPYCVRAYDVRRRALKSRF